MKPASLCHPLNSVMWAVKLIDFDAAVAERVLPVELLRLFFGGVFEALL